MQIIKIEHNDLIQKVSFFKNGVQNGRQLGSQELFDQHTR